MSEGGGSHSFLGSRVVRAVPPLLCAIGVALGAYASHAGEGADRTRLGMAALFAFGHGVALIALERGYRGSRLDTVARLALLVGVLLFSGSLVLAAWLGWAPRLAPMGGSLMIVGWLVLSADRVLHRTA